MNAFSKLGSNHFLQHMGGGKLKISQLQALVAIADLGSFSEAALELELSQSTISHSIATLEDAIGVVLLARGRQGATLTPEGEQLLPDARAVLQLLESMQQKAQNLRDLQDGQVRLAAVRSIATHVLPQSIAQFRQKYPRLSVSIAEFDRFLEVEQTLREGRAEIGFTSLPTAPEFAARELFRDEFVALLPPHSLAPNAALTWSQLVQFPMILNLRNFAHNKMVRDHLAQFGYALNIDYEVREDSTIVGMVKQGLGATIITRLSAEPIPADVQLRRLPVPLERIIGVITIADALLPRSVFAFLDLLEAGKR